MPKKKWVLTVDDDPAILEILGGALEHPELTITTANDALQAFIQARNVAPLLIISDIQMPGYGNGTETLRMLREDPRIPRVPILFMTGMPLEKARALLPADDRTIGLIPKPLDLDRLRQYVWGLAGVSAPKTRKVLVVEPDPSLVVLICDSLRDAGFQPVACAPEEAVALAAEVSASAIVAALSSLSAEPPPLYTALRADPRTKDVVLVLITGRRDVTIRRRLGEKPPYVLFKPFEPATLVQTVTKAIAAA